MKITKSELKQLIKEEIKATMDEGFLDKVLNRVSGADKLPSDVIIKHWPDGNRDRPPKVHSVKDGKDSRKLELGPMKISMQDRTLKIEFDGAPARIGDVYSDESGVYQADRNTDI